MKKRLLPLGIKNPIKTELPALIALEAIGKPWFAESHRSDLLVIGLITQMLAPEGSFIHVIADELITALDPGGARTNRTTGTVQCPFSFPVQAAPLPPCTSVLAGYYVGVQSHRADKYRRERA